MALVLFGLLSFWVTSRLVSHHEGPPAFFVHPNPTLQLELVGEWSRPGVHQFFDDIPGECVTRLTVEECALIYTSKNQLVSGLVLYRSTGSDVRIDGWIPASQRMALQIPLHPDRMTRADWPSLPGIGPYLGDAIETDRQLNGDFGRIDTLRRVKGIGEKRLGAMLKYFYPR